MPFLSAPRLLRVLVITLIAWSAFPAPARAQYSYTWQGVPGPSGPVYGGGFSDGMHWFNNSGNPNVNPVPGPLDTANIGVSPGQPYTVDAGLSGTTVQNLTVSSAQATLSGSLSVGNAVNISAGTFTGNLDVGGSFILNSGGTFSGSGTFNGSVTTQSGTLFQDNGTIRGSANFTINGALDFNQSPGFIGTGTMTANGPTTVSSPAEVDGTATLVLNGAVTANASLGVRDTATVRLSAGATMTDTGDNTFGPQAGQDGATFDIRGSFVKNGGTGSTSLVANLATGGLIRAQTGTIVLASMNTGQHTHAGTIQADAGAAILFDGSHLVPAGSTATLTGPGTFRVDGVIRVDGTLASTSATPLGLVSGGSLTGSGTATGAVAANGGATIAPGNGTPTGSLTLGSLTFNGQVKLQVTGGASGTAPLHLTGALTPVNGSDQFAVQLKGGSGLVAGQSCTWTLIHSDVPLTGITPDNFVFNGSDFALDPSVPVVFNVGLNDVTVTFTPVPEPAEVLAMTAGFGLLGWVRRRRGRPCPG